MSGVKFGGLEDLNDSTSSQYIDELIKRSKLVGFTCKLCGKLYPLTPETIPEYKVVDGCKFICNTCKFQSMKAFQVEKTIILKIVD